jgi:glycerate kinase
LALQNKALVLVDKFKGSLTQSEINQVVSRTLFAHNIKHRTFVMADGGDGSLAALASVGWTLNELKVTGPLDFEHEAKFAISPDGKIAALELSELCGIKYLTAQLSPNEAHTRAIGEALLKISTGSWQELWLLLGGSASNDGGLGILQGLGIQVHDSKGNAVRSGLSGLQQAARIDERSVAIIKEIMRGRKAVLISDVSSPLLGSKGAIATFGRQKGLDRTGRLRGEVAMRRWRRLVVDVTKRDESKSRGAGAAGGAGFLALSFLSAEYRSGASSFLELVGAHEAIDAQSTVFTGEGRIDESSLSGKCVVPILEIVKKKSAKAILVCGSYDEGVLNGLISEYPITAVVALSHSGLTKSEQISNAAEVLYDQLMKSFQKSWF